MNSLGVPSTHIILLPGLMHNASTGMNETTSTTISDPSYSKYASSRCLGRRLLLHAGSVCSASVLSFSLSRLLCWLLVNLFV